MIRKKGKIRTISCVCFMLKLNTVCLLDLKRIRKSKTRLPPRPSPSFSIHLTDTRPTDEAEEKKEASFFESPSSQQPNEPTDRQRTLERRLSHRRSLQSCGACCEMFSSVAFRRSRKADVILTDLT